MANSQKCRVILIGGMNFNVPRQLREHFEIVAHVVQDQRKVGQLPVADHIVVIRNWVSHVTINAVRRQFPEHPMIWVNKGWNSMREELERRGILKIEDVSVAAEDAPEEPVASEDAKPDPLETMSMEELDKLTAPDALAKAEDGEAPTGDGGLWEGMVRKFAGRWFLEASVPVDRLIKFGMAHKNRSVSVTCVCDELEISDIALAKGMSIGYNRHVSFYRSKTDPTYVPRRGVGRVEPEGPVKAAPVSVVPPETEGMILGCQKLVDKRNELLKKREELDMELAAVDRQIEAVKPVLQAMEALNKATRAVRDKIGSKVG